jgi:predicted regulator of Ras-like GTPase activity (Roadblock/LC7/MglB family)
MATGNVGTVIKDLKARIGGTATAPVSRDGLILFADVPAGVYTETFALKCATILGAAATANTELNQTPPSGSIESFRALPRSRATPSRPSLQGACRRS